MKTRPLTMCLALTACVSAPELPELATDGGSEESDAASGDPDPATTRSDDDDTGDTLTSADTTDPDTADETGTDETCGTSCADGQAEVRWIAEPGGDLLGGRCLDVVADGKGGAVASFLTDPESPLAGGLMLALSDAGDESERVVLAQRYVEGLERAGPGAFAWVDTTAYAGQSTTSLDDLDGAPLSGGVWAADDIALTTGGTAYSIVSGSFLPECRVRMNGNVDSEPFGCGGEWDRWRIEPDGAGVAGGLVGQSALVRVDGSGQIVAVLDYRYQRTLLDLAVGEDGEVWTVGVIANPNDAGPSFGAFVARHDAGLAETPPWEGVEDGDTSLAWTAVVVHDGAPVLVGRDAEDLPRITALTHAGDIDWTLTVDLPPSVLLRQADVDATGRLVACGERAAATPVVVAVDLP